MELFDCYCCYGEMRLRPPSYSKNATELIDVMDGCGIENALVFHSTIKYGSPVLGNRLVIEESRGFDRLHPVWAILPSQTSEQEESEGFIRSMKKSNIKALFAFPDEHGYLLDEVVFCDLFEELTDRHVPLFLKPGWQSIYSLLSRFPDLTVVAVGHGPHGSDRYFRPLVEKYKNFYIDTSSYLQDGGIEAFCDKYGAHRMLFGTGYPGNCIGGPVLRALRADVDATKKELICHKNLERLLRSVRL
jgi:hypothetical protein